MTEMNDGKAVYICPKCGFVLKQAIQKHIDVCAALPSWQEIEELLDESKVNNCTSIARQYRTNMGRIRAILLKGDTKWTPKSLRGRGYKAKYIPQKGSKRHGGQNARIDYRQGRFDCADGCGMMVVKPGQICQFCHFDKVGLSHYTDFIDVKDDDPRLGDNEKVFFLPRVPREEPTEWTQASYPNNWSYVYLDRSGFSDTIRSYKKQGRI